QIHPIVRAAHEAELGGAQVLVDRARLMMLDQQENRRHLGLAVLCIDLGRKPAYALVVVAIVADRRSRRRGDLNERESSDPARMDLQEARDGAEALFDALRVVEPVDADAD